MEVLDVGSHGPLLALARPPLLEALTGDLSSLFHEDLTNFRALQRVAEGLQPALHRDHLQLLHVSALTALHVALLFRSCGHLMSTYIPDS